MDLIQYCFDVFNKEQLQRNNGVACTKENIAGMLWLIGKPMKLPSTKHLEALTLSEDGAFSNQNFADVIALIFEVIVEENANPSLWGIKGPGGIEGEIATTIRIFAYGPAGVLTENLADGVKEVTFKEAKAKLLNFLKKSRNLFF